MIEIGKINRLQVIKLVDFGLYLDGLEWEEILLPQRYIPTNTKVGDWLDVFIYFDSEDRIIATTEPPVAQVNECAYLKVVDVNNAGAFLDWGLEKDLMVPFSEQRPRMQVGQSYLVYIYCDEESERITASARLNQIIKNTCDDESLQTGDAVSLIIAQQTELGYKVVVNHRVWGLLYENEVFSPLSIGQTVAGKIKKRREDGKLDCMLEAPSAKTLEQQILDYLNSHQGQAEIGDKTDAEIIYSLFEVSKKVYKRTLSQLYKARQINIQGNCVKLVTKDSTDSSAGKCS